jgi:hypothetical protein
VNGSSKPSSIQSNLNKLLFVLDTDQKSSTAMESNAFDIPWIKDLTDLITSNLRNNFNWLGVQDHEGGIKLMDYACGNGIMSRV